MKLNIKINILIVFLFLFTISFSENQKRILVMHSYHNGFYWTDSITDGIYSVFGENKDYELYYEYLDLKRQSSEKYLNNLVDFYKVKNRNLEFDGIVVSDNLALNFVINNREELFPDIPIAFCGINNYDETLVKNVENIVGIIERADYRGTLDLMLLLHPEAKEVLVIIDSTFTGNEIKKEFSEIIPEYKSKVDFELFDSYTLFELENKLKQLTDETLVLALVMNKSRDGKYISYKKGAEYLEMSDVPVYLTWESYFGKGAVGGKITSGYLQGRIASKMLQRIFAGESSDNIGVKTQLTSVYKIDYNAIKKHAIDKSKLPLETTIINRPKNFYERNEVPFIFSTFVFLFLTTILIFILRYNLKKKNEKIELNLKLEGKISERAVELEKVNKRITEQQSRLEKRAYNEGFMKVKTGIIHNIGNVINPLYIVMQEEINYKETDEKSELKFLEKIVYDELMTGEVDSARKAKIATALKEIIEIIRTKKKRELSRLKYCQKEINHLKSIIKLQKNYLGTLGTESYVAINELLKEVIEKRELDYKISLELELNSVEKVLCDRTQIIQVFENIIKNQVEDLLESEKVYKVLKLSTSEDEKNVIVAIRDNGDLYSEEFVKNIFDLSFITKEKNRKNFELYGCYQIIKKYGGNITFDSDSRKGNIFLIYIPK